ncbi:hypothetical protein EC973_004691 [Apophysomyces ossiformis]|uniref:ER membrane protein complex subunit 10 n=1 Tax=Apophysomyces ossiformis TaxID=679940 RepID=A0A8H7BK79_9FUNG|nr:hypothetical protein EC973_004691 [Apophysomyces ossiformis]
MLHSSLLKAIPLYLCIYLCALNLGVKAQEKLSVYHKQGEHFQKRGEIINLHQEPVYVSTHEVQFEVSDPQALYQVKVKDERSGNIMLSSVKYDEFKVHVDNANNVYHVDYFADGIGCTNEVQLPLATKPFSSSVTVKKALEGPKPQQQKRPATRTEAQNEYEEKEEEPEKTFFQKYWYLLLAGALLFISSANPPPEQAQQQQQQQRR